MPSRSVNQTTSRPDFPLHCSVCPHGPRFKDVSHLLTHLASKAHLSNHYKLSVKADGDANIRAGLIRFDAWYSENGLGELMAHRMVHKEKKKKAKNALKAAAANAPQSSSRQLQTPFTPDSPFLTPKTEHSTPPPTLDPAFNAVDLQNILDMPQMLLKHEFDPSQVHSTLWQAGDHSMLVSPPSTQADDLNSFDGRSNYTSETFTHDSAESETVANDDHVTLKGIIYPGMDVFDSATLEDRRRRNQRKDCSVLARLERHSRAILQHEMVYDTEGHYRKTFVITGRPDPDSPDLYPQVLPSLHTHQSRAPLVDMPTNVHHVSQQYSSTQDYSYAAPATSFKRAVSVDDTDQESASRKRRKIAVHTDAGDDADSIPLLASPFELPQDFEHSEPADVEQSERPVSSKASEKQQANATPANSGRSSRSEEMPPADTVRPSQVLIQQQPNVSQALDKNFWRTDTGFDLPAFTQASANLPHPVQSAQGELRPHCLQGSQGHQSANDNFANFAQNQQLDEDFGHALGPPQGVNGYDDEYISRLLQSSPFTMHDHAAVLHQY